MPKVETKLTNSRLSQVNFRLTNETKKRHDIYKIHMRSNPPLILVFSTARRLQYFARTLSSLVLRNPDLCEFIHRVYILDDRSSMEDREAMRLMVGNIFGPALVHLITFDDESDWGYVRKLNFLRSLTVNGTYTLFFGRRLGMHRDAGFKSTSAAFTRVKSGSRHILGESFHPTRNRA